MKRPEKRKRASRARVVAYRGVELRSREFRRIQRLIARLPKASRAQIARETCRLFGWVRPNGAPPLRSCQDLLIRLGRMGWIELPEARRKAAKRKPGLGKEMEWLLLTESDYEGKISLSGELVVRPVRSEERWAFQAYMRRYHYLGSSRLVGESMRYAAFVDGDLVALIGFSGATLCNGPRDRYIGWNAAYRRVRLHLVVNNGRYLVLPWVNVPNLASRVLGAVLRRVSSDYKAVYGHPVFLAETFVDPSRFRGTCYLASNWIHIGQTKGWSRQGQRYREHGQKKDVFVYPLCRDALRELREPLEGVSQGKETEEMKLDVQKLPLQGKGGLLSVFAEATDTRKPRGLRHTLKSILAVATCAVLAGQRSFVGIEEWARDQSRETLLRLGCWLGRAPSERTLRRVLKHVVNPEEMDERLSVWVTKQQATLNGMGIAIDGKTLKGSKDGETKALHLLSAVAHGTGVVLAQTRVDGKTNEITRVRPLLDAMDIEGAVVTADAMHVQSKTTKFLVEEKRADYVMIVKDNQPTLREDIKQEFESRRRQTEGKRSQISLGNEAFPPYSADDR